MAPGEERACVSPTAEAACDSHRPIAARIKSITSPRVSKSKVQFRTSNVQPPAFLSHIQFYGVGASGKSLTKLFRSFPQTWHRSFGNGFRIPRSEVSERRRQAPRSGVSSRRSAQKKRCAASSDFCGAQSRRSRRFCSAKIWFRLLNYTKLN